MGLIAGPESPPVRFARTGLRVSMSITIAVKVLMRLSAFAPASMVARARALMSVTLGESLTMSTLSPAAFRTTDVISPTWTGSRPKLMPPLATSGN